MAKHNSFHTCTVFLNISGGYLRGLSVRTQKPCFCSSFTLRAPLYHVWVARVTQGKGGAEWGEEDRGHIIFFLNTDLISCSANMQRNTETALKTRMEPSSTKHLSIISSPTCCSAFSCSCTHRKVLVECLKIYRKA